MIFSSTEFWAAIVGGAFTLVGALASMWMQQHLQNLERTKISKSLFQEQIRHFNLLVNHIENHFTSRGEIWYQYIDNIDKSYGIVGRYMDYIVFIEEKYRTDLRNFFSNIYYMPQQAKFWRDSFYEKTREIERLDIQDQHKRTDIEKDITNAQQQMKDKVLELKRLSLSVPRLSLADKK